MIFKMCTADAVQMHVYCKMQTEVSDSMVLPMDASID